MSTKTNIKTNKKAKCYNCKYASIGFKIGLKTHHQCNHPKHDEGFKNGTLSPWDTLQEFYNSCESHEFKVKEPTVTSIWKRFIWKTNKKIVKKIK